MADTSDGPVGGGGKTELDSHTNMVVIGAQGNIIQKTGKYSDVNGFSSDVGTMSRVPIVDAVLAYDFPIPGKTTLLVARIVLFVQSMNHNLIPSLIMLEAGLKVEEQAKIHVEETAKENHSFYSSEINLRISLQLMRIF